VAVRSGLVTTLLWLRPPRDLHHGPMLAHLGATTPSLAAPDCGRRPMGQCATCWPSNKAI